MADFIDLDLSVDEMLIISSKVKPGDEVAIVDALYIIVVAELLGFIQTVKDLLDLLFVSVAELFTRHRLSNIMSFFF